MTSPSLKALSALASRASSSLQKINQPEKLEPWRIAYLGRQGKISQLLRAIKDLPLAERKTIGRQGNQLRRELTDAYAKKLRQLTPAPGGHGRKPVGVWSPVRGISAPTPRSGRGHGRKPVERFTNLVSSPVDAAHATPTRTSPKPGHLHPLTIAVRDLQVIFTKLGFTLVEGPLVEELKYNFDLLNIPLEHPARAATDTFHLTGDLVLRTHTSPVQLRSVLAHHLTPPFSIYSPGRVFRAERTDASHDHTFHQVEALMVGENVSLADFKGVVDYLYSAFFRQTVVTRLRPSYFPFVEPGFEVDMSCVICHQQGCGVCQQSGWLEMMGAGMVHPQVLRHMNIDPEIYQGFAFGGGIERLAILRHGITDIRLFQSGDLKFLRQFS